MPETKTEAELIMEDIQEMRVILSEANMKLAQVKIKIDAISNSITRPVRA